MTFGSLALALSPVFAQQDGSASPIELGIEFTIEQRYSEAEAAFQQFINEHPDDPAGYFYRGAAVQARMMDWDTEEDDKDFLRWIEQAERLARQRLRRDPNDATAHYYLGSALSYKAYHHGRRKHYPSALRHGLRAVAELEKALRLDSTVTDAYYGIGTYKYWRSRLTAFLHWLPLVEDEREVGIAMIRRAAQGPGPGRLAAQNGLAWILLDAGHVEESIQWSQRGLARFPRSRFFLWPLADAYFRKGAYALAAETYKTILQTLVEEGKPSPTTELQCRWRLARCYAAMEDCEAALQEVQTARALKLSPPVERKLKGRLEKLRAMERDCEKKQPALPGPR